MLRGRAILISPRNQKSTANHAIVKRSRENDILFISVLQTMRSSDIRIVERPSLELFRETIKYVNRNLKARGFGQIATNTTIPLKKAREWHEALLARQQICAIAIKSDLVVGASHLDIWHGRRNHTSTLAITVDKHHRRQGIAKALMTSIISQAREEGIKVIIAEPSEDNLIAINLLKKFGFREAGRIKNGFRSDDGSFKDLIVLQALI